MREDLHRQRLWYSAEKEATEFIGRVFCGKLDSYSDIATLALRRLGWHSGDRAEHLINDRKLLDLIRGSYQIASSVPGGFVAVRSEA